MTIMLSNSIQYTSEDLSSNLTRFIGRLKIYIEMSSFNLLPKPTSMLNKVRFDSDDLSVDSTGSEKRSSNNLGLSEGPKVKNRKDDRDFGYMTNSDLVIPQPRKSSHHSQAAGMGPSDRSQASLIPKLLDIK